jgi:hypothetical protein
VRPEGPEGSGAPLDWDRGYWGDGYPSPAARWGNECGRGIAYKNTGAVVTDGTANQRRSISSGRKARGMASDDYKGDDL